MELTFFNCTANFADFASGQVPYSVGVMGVPYPVVLFLLAFLMGLGKGGVPGSSTSSVALNSLLAPSGSGCLDASVALGVPITFMADVMVVISYFKLARWDVIWRLLPSTALGVALGTQLMGRLSESQARLLIGSILLLILAVNAAQSFLVPKPAPKKTVSSASSASASSSSSSATAATGPSPTSRASARSATKSTKSAEEEALRRARSMSPELAMSQKKNGGKTANASEDQGVPAYANSVWFAAVVGLVGGFATILTNSMGPMLNVFLLTLRLEPTAFVGTRATFFTCINTLKLIQRLWTGTLGYSMLKWGSLYGVVAVLGVKCSTFIIPRMSKELFMKLEYAVMTFAAFKLIDKGLDLGYL